MPHLGPILPKVNNLGAFWVVASYMWTFAFTEDVAYKERNGQDGVHKFSKRQHFSLLAVF